MIVGVSCSVVSSPRSLKGHGIHHRRSLSSQYRRRVWVSPQWVFTLDDNSYQSLMNVVHAPFMRSQSRLVRRVCKWQSGRGAWVPLLSRGPGCTCRQLPQCCFCRAFDVILEIMWVVAVWSCRMRRRCGKVVGHDGRELQWSDDEKKSPILRLGSVNYVSLRSYASSIMMYCRSEFRKNVLSRCPCVVRRSRWKYFLLTSVCLDAQCKS